MSGPNSVVSTCDGSLNWSGGVDSLKTTTIQSVQQPDGLARNELAWLVNGTVQDGGITPRAGWKYLNTISDGTSAYQGGYMYQPPTGDPYIIPAIGGHIYKVVPGEVPIDLSLASYSVAASPPVVNQVILTNIDGGPVGTTVPDGSVDPIGSYSSFVIPSIGQNVGVTIPNPYIGPLNGIAEIGLSDKHVWHLQAQSHRWYFRVNQGSGFVSGSVGPSKLVVLSDSDGYALAFTPCGNSIEGGFTCPTYYWDTIPPGALLYADSVTKPTFTASHGGPGCWQLVEAVMGGFDANHPDVVGSIVEVGTVTQVTAPDASFYEHLELLSHDFGPPIGTITQPGYLWSSFGPTQFSVNNSIPLDQVKASYPGITNWINANTVTDMGPAPGHYRIFSSTPIADSLLPNTDLTLNKSIPQYYFCQAEQWLIIQAGDMVTLPLFWDGAILRRSLGITDTAVAPGTPGVNEIPAAGPMVYNKNRLWYAQGRTYSAGDIVGGNSGTAAYNFRDSVLNVTENPLVIGGDGFTVPSQTGDITALADNASIDTATGEGRLFAFTEKAIYSLSVPVTRNDWIAATNNNQPAQTIVQFNNGAAGDRSVVAVNGDLFFQSLEPSVRSLITAMRYFNQWGNVPISSKMNRLLMFTDRSLLRYASGIFFDNRLIQTALPVKTNQGVIHQALMVLDFTPLSKFGSQLDPIWEGMYEGLDILQMFTGIFNGEERAFAIVVSRKDKSIQLWEMTKDDRFDQTDQRIQMVIEFPAFTWGQEFELKKQISAELWIDRLYGEVIFTLEYRPDGETCWQKWHEWKVCSPRNSCENTGIDPCTGLEKVQCYPMIQYGESYVQTMTLPKPPINCSQREGRPSNVNYQFQPKLTVKGFCRVRGLLIHAEKVDRKLYANMVC